MFSKNAEHERPPATVEVQSWAGLLTWNKLAVYKDARDSQADSQKHNESQQTCL